MQHMMIDEFIPLIKQDIDALYDVWKLTSNDFGYPVDYQGITSKAAPLLAKLECLYGRRVLDIGCNSGLYSYVAGMYAESVTGCDVEQVLIKRAEEAREFYERYYDTRHVGFYHGNFVAQLHNDIDAVVASLVLYHVGDENLLKLQEFLIRRKPIVLLQARPGRAEAFKRNPSWGILAATTIYNGMYRVEDNLEFLRDCGYDCAEVCGLKDSEYYGELFPVIVAKP